MLHARVAPSKWRTLVAVCLGLGMLMIDTFVVNVAFPAIGRDLRANLSTAEWAVSGYVLAVAVLPVAMGRIGDIFGRRRVYLAGLVLFVASSAACGAAQSIGALIAFRVLQGAGAAIMFPGTLSIITQAFPPQQRGLAIGLWGGVSGLGLIAGPVLGGLLVRGDSWRWIFLINLPVGLLALAMALLFVPESRDDSAPRSVDWPGLALLSAPLFLIMFGITRANDEGWTSPLILGCFVAGAALLPLFVVVEGRTRHPLIDLSLFRNTAFVMACVAASLFSATVFGSQPYSSLFMQNYWGFSPLQSGLAMLPATVLVASIMPLSGVLGQRLGPRIRLLIIAGSLAVLASALYLLRLDTESTYLGTFLPAFVVRGVGVGLVMSSSSVAVMSAVPVRQSGLASGTLTMARNVGTSFGVALFGAVYLHHVDGALSERLAGVEPGRTARIAAAAEHLVPAGDAAVRVAVEQVIVDGFVQISLVAAVLAAVAAVAAVFIRGQRPVPQPATAPARGATTAAAREA